MRYTPKSTPEESYNSLYARHSDSLLSAVEKFRLHMTMRLLAVLDDEGVPIGVIREDDVRGLLYNPFGHALMNNPGFGMDIHGLIVTCATADKGLSATEMVALHSKQPSSPGLILTDAGKFAETLSNERLIEFMSQDRLLRAEQITTGGELFTGQILALSDQLSETADQVHELAELIHHQADGMADAANNVAANTKQSLMGLQDVNERGRDLVTTMTQVAGVIADAKTIRGRTKYLIDGAVPHMRALSDSGAAICDVTTVIHNMVKQTNFLALNAQIEAARQDVGGPGFLAVAGEIKQLARQTRGSAHEVSEKAQKIEKTVVDVLIGHQEIVKSIEQIADISEQIDASVDKQSASGIAIAGFVEQAVVATSDIATEASDIGARAGFVQAKAKELERVSEILLSSAANISMRSRNFVEAMKAA